MNVKGLYIYTSWPSGEGIGLRFAIHTMSSMNGNTRPAKSLEESDVKFDVLAISASVFFSITKDFR